MTPEKANQIAAEFICEGMQHGDPVPALAKIILSASKVQAGHVRDDNSPRVITDPAERDRALTCAFCGLVYPEGTPTHKHEALTAHILTCPKHPVGLELADTKRELSLSRHTLLRLRGALDAYQNTITKTSAIQAIEAAIEIAFERESAQAASGQEGKG